MREFSEAPAASNRIFIAELLPLADEQRYPDQIGDPLRAEFWGLPERGSAATYSQSNGPCEARLNDLAATLAKRLIALREHDEAPASQRKPNPEFPPILLARVTDDLEPKRRQLRTYLEQFDLNVLPGPDDFQEEGAAFGEEFARLLDCKPIVVQLLSSFPARRTRDNPDGFDGLQGQLTLDHPGVRLVKWRDRDLDLAGIEDPQHRALLTDKVDAMDFEGFKEMIVRVATMPPPVPRAVDGKVSSFLFIDADQVDAETARKILRICRERKIIAMMPEYGVDTRKDWRANYATAERIAVIYKEGKSAWLTAQLRMYLQIAMRARAPQQCLIYLAGPPAKERDAVTVVHPNFEFIDAPDGDLGPLLERLAG